MMALGRGAAATARSGAAQAAAAVRGAAAPQPRAGRRLTQTEAGPAQREDLGRARKLAAPLGFAAGLFGSLVGIGGGALITPVLVRITSVPPRVISGTSLCAVLATSAAAGWAYSDAGQVDWPAAGVLGAAAMATAGAGARAVHQLPPRTTRRALGLFLCCVAPLVPAKAWALRRAGEGGQGGGGGGGGGGGREGGWRRRPLASIRRVPARGAYGDRPRGRLCLGRLWRGRGHRGDAAAGPHV